MSEALARSIDYSVQLKRKRVETQRARHLERHGYLRGNIPALLDDMLRLLERASFLGSDMDSRRKEVVRLPGGVRVSFRGTPSQSILEIMQRTGSHAQVIHFSQDDAVEVDPKSPNDNLHAGGRQPRAFNALTLWGTPAENDAALNLLPEMVMPIHGGRPLSEELKIGEYEIDITSASTTASEDLRSTAPEKHCDLVRSSGVQASDSPDETEVFRAIEQWREEEQDPSPPVSNMQQHSGARIAEPEEHSVVRPVWNMGAPDAMLLWSARLRSGVNPSAKTIDESSPFDGFRSAIDSSSALTYYVAVLTSSPSRLLRRRITSSWAAGRSEQQSKTSDIAQKVSSELISLFNDRRLDGFVNQEAVNYALSHGVRTSNYSVVHELLSVVEKNTLYKMTSSNYNIMLAAAAKREDVHNFGQLLRAMIKRDIRPTSRTWILLHDLTWRVMPRDRALRVTDRLRRHGIFKMPLPIRRACLSIVKKDLTFHLERYPDFSLSKYIDRCDRLWGTVHASTHLSSFHRFAIAPRVWLSVETAHVMIHVLLLRGMMSEAVEVLRTLRAAGERPGTVILNTLLSFHVDNAAKAVAIVRDVGTFQKHSTGTAPSSLAYNARTYALLFKVAWDCRCFNMARVVWRYACCAGEVCRQLEQQMLRSIFSYVPAPLSYRGRKKRAAAQEQHPPALDLSRGQVYYGWVAKFAVGVSDGLTSPGRQDAGTLSMTYREHEVLQLSAQPCYAPVSDADSPATFAHVDASSTDAADLLSHMRHKARHDRLGEMLKQDLRETMSIKPEIPFPEMLQRAFEEDEKWQESGLGSFHSAKNTELAAQIAKAGPEERTRLFAVMFEQMLNNGIKVPMRVGDARSPRRSVREVRR
ncbi:pentatricopeptide repeat domain-containing protein [Teratosphaeria destructans]|uniref:Pentatricopeptide repeat domain-containing protein n=1 Tax=Teratosphaeria destructans TaxID=418781 RepID=A0A9W7W3U7_9PEZI|nr:pentatricopeptide repeat domain-containing protein [Teratosphaeria destructans]